MDLVSHRGITLILFCKSDIKQGYLFCTLSFDDLKSPLLNKCFSNLNLYEAVKSSDLVVQFKLKCLLTKPTHDDIIEAKEVIVNCLLKAI